MIALLICNTVAIMFWSVVSRRLERWNISGALAMVSCGTLIGFCFGEEIGEQLNTDLAEHIVELILAILLFVDATEVRGGFLAGARSIVTRLLVIALPLSLLFAVAIGLPLIGTPSVALVVVIACIVLPIDFAAAPEMLRNPTVPVRLRHSLAVESGYNDGIFSPVFAFALLLIGDYAGPDDLSPTHALQHALSAAGYAVLFGAGIGVFMGALIRFSAGRKWADASSIRIAVLLIPFVAYESTVLVQGNGFVAAFLAGLAYRWIRTQNQAKQHDVPHGELSLTEDVGVLASLFMWFILGSVVALFFMTPVTWGWILFSVLALTVLRLFPVYLAFLGSTVPPKERVLLGVMGPRGTSSIVFGLLAFNALKEEDANAALCITVITVLGSILFHSWWGIHSLGRRHLGSKHSVEHASSARKDPGR